jgi:hypothetical protein
VGCDVVDLNLLQNDVPTDLALLIIVGPRTPFQPDELSKLKAHTARGGPVLLLVGNTEPSGLDAFLKSFNLELGRGTVVDPTFNYWGDLRLILAPTQGAVPHPIVTALGSNRYVLLPNAAPIQIIGQSAQAGAPPEPIDRNLVPASILRASQFAWAETDLKNPPWTFDRGTEAGWPVTIGAAVMQRAGAGGQVGPDAQEKPRLVLFSSAALADNLIQGLDPTNLDLLMNAVSWLRGRPDTLGIAPKTHVALTLAVDSQLRSRLILVPTVTAAMLVIAMGITVYVARRE